MNKKNKIKVSVWCIIILMFFGCNNQNDKIKPFTIKIPSIIYNADQPYTDTLGVLKKAKQVSLSLNSKDSTIIVNGKKLNTNSQLHDFIKVIGKPDRFIKNDISNYYFDSLGFYVNTYPLNKLDGFSIDLIKTRNTELKNIFKQGLTIDGQKISLLTTPYMLSKSLNIKPFGDKHFSNYRTKRGCFVIHFRFTEKKDSLENVFIAW